MQFKQGDIVIYDPPYGLKGLPPEPVKAVVRSIAGDKVYILVKKGTEFVKRRHVSVENLRKI